MLTDVTVLAVLGFLIALVAIPMLVGLGCRRLVGVRLEPATFPWFTLAQCMIALGWGAAFALGSLGVMGYPASVLLGALIFVPGQFLLGFHFRVPSVS
jgi:hypothetical protein